ncbi:MAG TPA: pectate lyase [Crenotrichaceae bacterium]|nr:pectate lyase [Crenotrichaceae bacterium]
MVVVPVRQLMSTTKYIQDVFETIFLSSMRLRSFSVRGLLFFMLSVFLFGCKVKHSFPPLKAFPCAQGFGASSRGGRGGDVYHVTKLLDDGSVGTLRHALDSANGPRTVVFDIGGVITLNARLKIRTDKITLAGQTAPGGGITIAGYPFDIFKRSDVIIRYLRFRLGDYNAIDPHAEGDGKGNMDLWGDGGDAISVSQSNDLILDHISASWGMDETVSIVRSKNITLQNSILSEGLFHSYHPAGAHSRGGMFVAGVTDSELVNGAGGYTIYQNLFAHHNMRNPVVGGQMYLDPGQDKKNRKFMLIDFENNVIYNWGKRSGHTARPQIKMNYINNYLIAGPSTQPKNIHTAMREENSDEGDFYIFFSGNYMDTDKDSYHNGKAVGAEAFPGFEPGEYLNEAFPFPAITFGLSAEDAYQEILRNAGASFPRDLIDKRVINHLKNQLGRLINSQDDVGGLGYIARGIALIDTDRDGMPDSWETKNGLDPKNSADRNKIDISMVGYTNLEVYLDSLVRSGRNCTADTEYQTLH